MKLEDFLKKMKDQTDDTEGIDLRYLFINQLQSYRRLYGLTQTAFAETVGLKQQAIARFEKGEIDPRLSFISKILKGISKKIMIDDIKYETGGIIEKTTHKSNIIEFKNKPGILTNFDKVC